MTTRSVYGNLRFTDSGVVWADFLLDGAAYAMKSRQGKELVWKAHQSLVRLLPGESLLLGVLAGLDTGQIIDKMLADVDRQTCPEWVAECEATRAMFEQMELGQRVYWLSVPLKVTSAKAWKIRARAAMSDVEKWLGLPAPAPSIKDLAPLLAASNKILENIPTVFHPRPATPAQMAWLHAHATGRGLFVDEILPAPQVGVQRARKSASAFPEPIFDEFGTTDRRKGVPFNPLAERFVKILDSESDGERASYQGLMVVADAPEGELPFPGYELLGGIDTSGLQVDWALRLNVVSSAEVFRKNRRALRTLNDQFNQQEGGEAHGANALERSAEALMEYASILEADKLEVEVRATMIFAVADNTVEGVKRQAEHFSSWISRALGYKVARPVGGQQDLWWQMQPGVATSWLTREYQQITTSAGLATTVPMISARLGDPQGMFLGWSIPNGPFLDRDTPCGTVEPILLDLAGATDRNISGSLAVAGDLGSGKSVVLKKVAAYTVDIGGRVIIPDRTDRHEWADWARGMPQHLILNVSAPEYSLDPLTLYPGAAGARIAQSFLIQLLNASPTSDMGILLSEMLDEEYLTRHGVTRLGELLQHAQSIASEGGEEVNRLARLLSTISRRDLGRVIFDETLPPLDVANPVIVFLTHELQLPKHEELANPDQFRQLSLEKIFGRALFGLITALAKHVCFEDHDRPAGFIVDEAHAVTISSEAVREITDFVRDGRKHRAFVALGSHDPVEDFPSEVLRGLIPYRLVMRSTDPTLARNLAEWIGVSKEDMDQVVSEITTNTSPLMGDQTAEWRRGEGILRDPSLRIGKIKVVMSARKERNQASRTGGREDVAA